MATPELFHANPTADRPPCRRRWIPLSLRVFVVILLLLGVGSALWIGVPAYCQQVAIREIERAGGVIGTSRRSPIWRLPGWLLISMGLELIRLVEDVQSVNLTNQPVTDATLAS